MVDEHHYNNAQFRVTTLKLATTAEVDRISMSLQELLRQHSTRKEYNFVTK